MATEPYSTGWKGPIIQPRTSAAAPQLAIALAGLHQAEVRLPGARAILDQKQVDCCISCAITTCVEVLYPQYEQLSSLYHYYETAIRFQGRAPGVNDGMEIDQGFRTLGSAGICLFSLHQAQFDAAGVAMAPSPVAEADGKERAMPPFPVTYVSPYKAIPLELDPVNDVKEVLAGGRPVLAGVQLTANYGAVKLLDPGSPTGARHAVAVLGYSDAEASFIIQDSRGPDWAQGGQWWLPYSILASPTTIVFQAFAVGYPPKKGATQ